MTDRAHAPLIAAAVVLWTLALLLTSASWRLAPAEWPYANLPHPTTTTAIAVLAVGLAIASFGTAPTARRPALAVLLAWPAVPLALAWLLLPFDGATAARLWPWSLPLVGIAWLLRRATARPRRRWHEGNLWRLLHAASVPPGAALAWWAAGLRDLGEVGLSLLLYPLYAIVQLTLLLVIPWPWWQRATGGDRRSSVAAIAAVFALVHWPNPAVMALCGVGMLVWAREHARGRGLVALAVSMGLWATLVAQGLSPALNQGMRVGPEAARSRAVAGITSTALATPTVTPREFVAGLYPAVVGRRATPAELDRWQAALVHEQRCVVAADFVTSDEGVARGGPIGRGRIYWTDLAAPWPDSIRAHVRAAHDAASWPAYLTRCYTDLLGRAPSPAEVGAWREPLTRRQFESLTRRLITDRRRLASAPFDTLDSASWRFWR